MIDEKIEEYCEEHSTPEDAVLHDLNRQTHLKVIRPKMLSGHLQGKFLEMFSMMHKPKHILEIGTYTGYSAICLAKGMPDNGLLITLEKNAELEEFILRYFEKAGISEKTQLLIGDAMDRMKDFEDDFFDLVFIDANKENYLNYFKAVKSKVRKGGYILVDNVLWYGKVVDGSQENDRDTKAIKAFNDYVQQDPEVTNFLLPLRDGIMIIQKL